MAAGIIKALFGIGKGQMKTIPWTKMTPELHNQLSSQLGKLMFVVKSQNLKLTKFQQDYLMNQLKHMEEFEKRVLTKTETPKPKGEVRPFMGAGKLRVQQDVDGIIKNLKSMEPMDAMKEANLIIGRKNPSYKGPYKNLSDDEAQRILKETDDHIFQRDIKPDPEDLASGGIAGPLHLHDGGRARFKKGGFDPSKRKFLKGTGAAVGLLSMIPFFGKFFKAAKPAIKTATPAAEVITRGADGIPNYVYDLINVVKAKGTKEIMEGVSKRFPAQKKYTYKGVEVTEDGLGTTSVRKQHEGIGYDEAGEGFEGVNKEVGFEIKRGEDIVKKGGAGDDASKVVKADDEYFEATVRPDAEGKMKDMEEFIDDVDHLDLKKIADEAFIKKAEGGLAHVLGV